jgi:hypothetical protein
VLYCSRKSLSSGCRFWQLKPVSSLYLSWKSGADGRTRTGTGNAQRIFLPATAFAAAIFMTFVVWTIPSPWRFRFRCCPSSLYTFPLAGAWLGIASEGFPEFEQFCIPGFPREHSIWLKSVASTSFVVFIPRGESAAKTNTPVQASSPALTASTSFFGGRGRRTLIAAASRRFLICEA